MIAGMASCSISSHVPGHNAGYKHLFLNREKVVTGTFGLVGGIIQMQAFPSCVARNALR